MGDVSSGMASAIIQVYLTEILHCFLHRVYQVRFWAMRVIEIVLRQGLIHPIKIVPYLICLSTDAEKEVSWYEENYSKCLVRFFIANIMRVCEFVLSTAAIDRVK